MCTNGINTGQFSQMIDQIDDHIKLERRWAHMLAHQAGDAGFAQTNEKLHNVQALLDDVRAMLDVAKDALEDDAENAPGVTVNLAKGSLTEFRRGLCRGVPQGAPINEKTQEAPRWAACSVVAWALHLVRATPCSGSTGSLL